MINMKKTYNYILLLFLILTSCNHSVKELKNLTTNDSIENWNYEWKRKYPNEFGRTYSFNKNGSLLKYSYIKVNGLREIYWENLEKADTWTIGSDSLLKFHKYNNNVYEVYKIHMLSKDSIQLIDQKFKDTSFLIKEKKRFNLLIKSKPSNFVIDFDTKHTLWVTPY